MITILPPGFRTRGAAFSSSRTSPDVIGDPGCHGRGHAQGLADAFKQEPEDHLGLHNRIPVQYMLFIQPDEEPMA